MIGLLKQIFEPFPGDHIFEDIAEPMTPLNVFGVFVFTIAMIVAGFWLITSIKQALSSQNDYLWYPHFYVSGLILPVIFISSLHVIYIRNKLRRAPVWREMRPARYAGIFLTISLLTAPLTSFALGHHVRSNGYERCHSIGGAHLSILGAHWVKPPLTCEEVDSISTRELKEAGWNVR